MDIKIKVIEELADGSAVCEVTYDAEALEFLIQKGTVAAIKEGIEQEKKCLMNSTKNTPARWVKKMLKKHGTNLNQKIDNLFSKLLTYTSSIGNTQTPIEPTFPTLRPGSIVKDSTMKSLLKPPKKKKSPGLQLKNLQSKKAKKSA
jgi:hypothetical protein